MRTLLVPVDFSSASLNAANYALNFAYTIRASITLVHVCQVPVVVTEAPVAAATFTSIIEGAEKRILEWKEELTVKSGGKLKIYTEVKEGYLVTQLQDLCDSIHPYAVIMGAGEATTARRMIFGSNIFSVMKHSSVPLIVVPKSVFFSTIDQIGLVCDLHDVNDTVHAEEIKKLVNDFKAQLHILHVNTEPAKMIKEEEIEGTEWLRDMFMELKPEFHFLNNENIEVAVNEFAEKNNFDMLIIIPKKHGLLEGIFHKSQARQLTLHTHLPVVAIHE